MAQTLLMNVKWYGIKIKVRFGVKRFLAPFSGYKCNATAGFYVTTDKKWNGTHTHTHTTKMVMHNIYCIKNMENAIISLVKLQLKMRQSDWKSEYVIRVLSINRSHFFFEYSYITQPKAIYYKRKNVIYVLAHGRVKSNS